MKFNKAIIFLFIMINCNFAQSIILEGEFGNFESAAGFSVTPGGLFFITDISNNEITKIDASKSKVKSVGGFGWNTSTFDEPSDIFATDLRVFVTDKNNDRIQVFDKDLNFLFLIGAGEDNNNFQFPTSCYYSNQGDIFILDSDNTRIMKFNSEGKFLLEFGNFSSGDFTLSSPTKLSLSHDSKIFVIDGTDIVVFDQFGMGLLRLTSKVNFTNINITFNNLVVNTPDSLFHLNLETPIGKFTNITPNYIDEDIEIIEGLIYNSKLYILTETNILHYKILIEEQR